MEEYRTEEEQLEALRRWWDENGRSMVVAVVIALSVVFGWRFWQDNEADQQQQASDMYQSILRSIDAPTGSPAAQHSIDLAEQLKSDYSGSTYAQFAALHLAALAVEDSRLPDAAEQLRWVLGKAAKGSDTAAIAQLRLARVLAASGEADQALSILQDTMPGHYAASYAVARGDILLEAGRKEEAREAYSQALALAGGDGQGANLPVLQQKLQSLMPVPPRAIEMHASEVVVTGESESTTKDSVDLQEE